MIDWQDLHHSELTVPQLYALLQIALRGLCGRTALSLPMWMAMI